MTPIRFAIFSSFFRLQGATSNRVIPLPNLQTACVRIQPMDEVRSDAGGRRDHRPTCGASEAWTESESALGHKKGPKDKGEIAVNCDQSRPRVNIPCTPSSPLKSRASTSPGTPAWSAGIACEKRATSGWQGQQLWIVASGCCSADGAL